MTNCSRHRGKIPNGRRDASARKFGLAAVFPILPLLAGIHIFGAFGILRAASPVTSDDQAYTTENTPVTVPVLANDIDPDNNQMAVLRITQPLHGKVFFTSANVATNSQLRSLFNFAGTQLSNSVIQIGNTNEYPRYTQTNGTWVTRTPGIGNWVSGFFPGCLWYLYEQTGDTSYQTWAERWMPAIAPLQYSNDVDDVGFMVNTSFGAGYRLVGNPDWRAVVLQAASSYSTRYNAAAGCLSTWGAITNQPFQVFVDSMMNLELLFHAYDLGGDTNFYTYAYSHAEKTMINHVRPDGSTYHVVQYDGNTGAVLWRGTFAGASDSSTWARGQSWAIYGFTMAYRETGDARFLNTAQRLADYYLTNVPADYVPYWDYQAPGIPNEPRDSSAAAIALSAFLELSQKATNSADSARYWQGAQHIFGSLSSANYLAEGSTSSGILLHGVGETPPLSSSEIDVSLIYGDYYFIEALKRYRDVYAHTALRYVPDTNFVGTDAFEYQVCDSGGNCATGTVTVVVSPTGANNLVVRISQAPDTHLPTLSFPTLPDYLYQVDYRDQFMNGAWSILATNLSGSGMAISVTDSNPPFQRLYRVEMRPLSISSESALRTRKGN
jgi:hypothetical protein